MKLGIVGLPNVGKSTLFNALTAAGAVAANFPFCTIEPNVGVAAVPDYRLGKLAELYNPKKIIPAVCEFVDIAGLVKGASRGEGLGNKFLSHIRNTDAYIHVTRCFDDPDVTHVDGSVNPRRDAETINTELIIADIETTEKLTERVRKLAKGDKSLEADVSALEDLKRHLDDGKPARTFDAGKLDLSNLITVKPVIYLANTDESGENEHSRELEAIAREENAECLAVCSKYEEELSALPESEKIEFLQEIGLSEPGLDRLIRASYKLLGYISFLTAGEPEVRAWTIVKGSTAPKAAGKIHGDFERGFIRAETVAFDDLMKCGSLAAAREKGLLRSEGKEYVVADGDVMHFRFNV